VQSALGRLFVALGLQRTQWLWRGFGVCLLVNAAITYSSTDLITMRARGEDQMHGLALAGLVLALFGARLLAIAFAGAWAFSCFGLVLSGHDRVFFFPAAEWMLWLALPLFSVLMILASLWDEVRRDSVDEASCRDQLDRALVAVFRVLCVATLGFAALHKLNSDFFDPAVSCVSLRHRLSDWWGLPHWLSTGVSPLAIVLLEGSVPIALVVPRLRWFGIGLALVLILPFVSIGAPAFAGLVVLMSLAFLPDEAMAAVGAGVRSYRWAIVASVVVLVGAGRLLYTGDFPWLPTALAQSLAVVAWWVFGLALRWQLRAGRAKNRAAPASAYALPMLVLLTALVLFNGLTPYLGIKFQYSFAMLSNLRVDDDRWNSFVFPRAMRLTRYDPFVHVTRTRYVKLQSGEVFESGGILDPALYSPDAVRLRVERAFARGVQVLFDFDYQGRHYAFADAPDIHEFYALIASFPAEPLFQKVLDAGRPQSCEH
jgi:hypothetical protein